MANRNPQPRPEAEAQGDPAEEIEAGKRLVHIGGDRVVLLAERIASQSRPSAYSASEAPKIVNCKPRGWLLDAYSASGQKPLGNWPAVFTGIWK